MRGWWFITSCGRKGRRDRGCPIERVYELSKTGGTTVAKSGRYKGSNKKSEKEFSKFSYLRRKRMKGRWYNVVKKRTLRRAKEQRVFE